MNRSYIYLAIIILILIILYLLFQNYHYESFETYFTSPDYLPNSNAFGNYYRIGYQKSKDLGWKPSNNWDNLRPEFNICPNQYRIDPIYYDDNKFKENLLE